MANLSPAGNCWSRRRARVLRRFSISQENALVVIDEPELTKAAAERYAARFHDAAASAGIPPESALIEWQEFAGLAEKRGTLELRQLEIAAEASDSFHIPTRPSMAFHGNLQVAIREAKTLLEAGTRLAFFAPTAGEVERLADMFSEYSLPYQIDLGGERVPEYLQMRAQSQQRRRSR